MRKPTAYDLEIWRSLRDAYRDILAAARECRTQHTDVSGLVAFSLIIAEYQEKFDALGRRISRAERSPC